MKISKNSTLNLLFKIYGYWIYKRWLTKTQYYPASVWNEFQFRQVRSTLLTAWDVPYYKALFKDINFDPRYDFGSLGDLSRIPLLTKSVVRNEYDQLINPKYKGIAVKYATSGSTGEPTKMLLTPYMVAIDKAMIFRHHSWSTRKFRPVIFALRSYVRNNEKAQYFRYSFLENTYYFSAYDLNRTNAEYYVNNLISINPHIIRGYPSSISFLCDFVNKSVVSKLTRLKGIYTASETLTHFERHKIEALFGRRVYNWYGMTEPAIIIKECDKHNEMHLCNEYGYAEFLDTDNSENKRLVTTSFYNRVMPFVRYDTGDLVEISGAPTSCQRGLPTVRTVIGRKDDYLVGTDGARQPSINFYTLFREFENVSAFQLVQFSTLEVLANVRSTSALTQAEIEAIKKGLELRLGSGIAVFINETEKFVTNSDGKTLVIVRKAGSYKLANYDLYSLSSQKAWDNYRHKIESHKLDWNEADETPVPEVLEFIRQLYTSDHLLKWYPEAQHRKLLTGLKKYAGMSSEDNVLIAHGSDNALRMIIQAFTNKSKCMVVHPTYDNFRAQAEGFGNEIVSISISDSSDRSMEVFGDSIKEIQPRLIYITNPNNPVGYYIESNHIAFIADIAKSSNALVIVDEAYYEFSGKTAAQLIGEHDNIIVVRTFSKAFGLAGIRLGYVLANVNIINEMNKICNPKDVTMFSAMVGEFLLDHLDGVKKYVEEVNANKKRFYEYCNNNGIRYYASEGNYVSFEVDKSVEYLRYLESENVFLRDRASYFNGEYVRVTIGKTKSFNAFLKLDSKYRERLTGVTCK